MTIAITIKRADNNPEHVAEVVVFDVTAAGGKRVAEVRTLNAADETTINIWGARSLEVREPSSNASFSPQPTEQILQFFAFDHLPPHLQAVSKPFGLLANHIVDTLPRNAERTVALRKLLESKDAAVRALVAAPANQT